MVLPTCNFPSRNADVRIHLLDIHTSLMLYKRSSNNPEQDDIQIIRLTCVMIVSNCLSYLLYEHILIISIYVYFSNPDTYNTISV